MYDWIMELDTKTCTVCKLPKPMTEEYFDRDSPSARTKDGFKGRCKLCRQKKKNKWRADYRAEHGEHDGARYQREHREDAARRAMKIYYELAEWVNTMKAKPCADCGDTFPPVCMDFDHRPGKEKKYDVAWLVSNRYSRKAILEEIEKCDLVCANCHRIRTWLSARETPWYDKVRKYDHSAA